MDDIAGPTAAGPVFRLIYRSHSRIRPEDGRTALGEVFTAARRNNKRLGITGALMTSGDAFVQVLEGDERAVRDLYDRICGDQRHEQLSVLREEEVPERTFGRWAMAKVSLGDGPDIRLVSNATRGVIVAAGPDASTTPEQETVLSAMREAIAFDTSGM